MNEMVRLGKQKEYVRLDLHGRSDFAVKLLGPARIRQILIEALVETLAALKIGEKKRSSTRTRGKAVQPPRDPERL
jgi:hypothetical protein